MGVKLVSASGGSVELNAPVTASNFTMTVPANNGTVITTASTFAGTGPTFSAYAATQSISASTWTKVKYSNEDWDTNNNYDPVTNYRFTPTVAGYYIINFSVNFGNATTANERAIALYKNGALYYGSSDIAFLAGNTTYYMSSSCQVYFNGSTDYVEVYVFSSAASTSAPGADNKFQGVMVRTA